MIETITREIDGHTYHLHQLGAKEGRAMLVRLTQVLGPAVGHLTEVGEGRMAEAVAGALGELAQHVTEKDLDWICETFGRKTEVDLDGGKRHLLDLEFQELHFAGRYGSMFRWIAACLEVNFADFFAMSASAAKSAGLAKRAPTGRGAPSPPSPTG